MQVAQRGTSFGSGANGDDAYTLDRWYIHSEASDVVDVTQSSTAPTNQLYSIGLDVETANKKFGIAQIIENKNCVGLIGNTVTLSFKAKVSNTRIDNVKAGIIAWSSTADAVTSAFVSSWGADGVTPTLASNCTFENTPANLNVTTSWATYSVTATIDTSSTTNVAVYIWSDDLDTTVGDFLYVTDVQLEQGSNATPFEHRSYGDELARCMRYYEFQKYSGVVMVGYSASIGRGSVYLSTTKRIQGYTATVVQADSTAYWGSASHGSITFTTSQHEFQSIRVNTNSAPANAPLYANNVEIRVDAEL
jgi:hypothetical protein